MQDSKKSKKPEKSKNQFERIWKWLQGSDRKPTTLEVLIITYKAKLAEARYKKELKDIDDCWNVFLEQQNKLQSEIDKLS
jgi:hypothetical protein